MPSALPPPVRPGDRVGVAALSGPVDRERLEAGLAELARLGFEPVTASNLDSRSDLFAGDDAERLAAFERLAADPELRAVFFVRGGHGVLRVLPGIDWARLARNRRAYVGYSDLTPFLLEVVRRTGTVAFHGPMVATDLARGLDVDERESLLTALAGELPAELPVEGWLGGDGRAVEGPILGGCLTLLSSTLGTPWRPRLGRAILLLEDVGEPLYRLDRLLTHLRLSGSLAAVRGIVIGSMRGLDEAPDVPSSIPERVSRLAPGVPVAWGAPFGHGGANLTIPLGATARLVPGAPAVEILAPGAAR